MQLFLGSPDFQDALIAHKQEFHRGDAADRRVHGLLQRTHHTDATVPLRKKL